MQSMLSWLSDFFKCDAHLCYNVLVCVCQHGEHYKMELYEGQNFTGQCVELCEDSPFLQSSGFSKSCLNSIKVYGDGA